MAHTVDWKIRLQLFEEQGTTKAKVVLDTGAASLTGQGVAHCSPQDRDIPEIGDEFAAGRALHDLGEQLMTIAERDVEAVGAAPEPRTSVPYGWPT